MMTKSYMEVLSPTSAYVPSSNWILGEKRSGHWTQQENKIFEKALAQFDTETPDRWEKVAAKIPGKTVIDVICHYQDLEDDVIHIESGMVPFPRYNSSSFTLDWENSNGFDGMKQPYCVGGKRSGGRLSDQERKKGVPWTEEEHKRFLMGLKKYGKGDWRNISRNFVGTRTPTQVASHAQKYFIRLNSGSKDKRRASIHDITTVNLPDNSPPSPSQPSMLSMQSTKSVALGRSDQFSVLVDADKPDKAASAFSPSTHGNRFMQPPYGMTPYGMKLEAQDSFRGTFHDSMAGCLSMLI